jgi:hypothetical protein
MHGRMKRQTDKQTDRQTVLFKLVLVHLYKLEFDRSFDIRRFETIKICLQQLLLVAVAHLLHVSNSM